MKLFRIICWLLFPLCIGTIQSCCDCGDPITYHYSITRMRSSNLDNGGTYPIETSQAIFPEHAYGIRLLWNATKVAYHAPSPSFFIQSAYAMDCYCDPFHGVARDSVIALRFTTIEDFDSVHHAGADVSDYFFENATKPLPQSDMLNNPHTFWGRAARFYCYGLYVDACTNECR